MADNVNAPVAAEVDNLPVETGADLKEMMAMSLGGGVLPQEPGAGANDPGVQAPNAESAAAVVAEPATVNDPFGLIKEKFGYESHEAAIKEIEELRAFKAQPRNPEFTVPDDESALILKALASGKRDEVYKYLDHEMRIERLLTNDVNKETAADIVKMGMQLKYKDLTPDEISYKFNKQFALPPEPKQTMDEDDDAFMSRHSSWEDQVRDKQMELMIEAKMVKPELQNAKGKLTIPEIDTPVDEDYIQYRQMLEQKAKDDAANTEAYKSITPKALETRINFKDEINKVGFEYQFEPDAEGFAKAVQIASDAGLFWQTFRNSDGTPNRERFLDMIYYVINKEKVLTSAMNQAKNATIKATLPDNSQGGLVRQVTQSQEPNELDQMMQMSFLGNGRR
jgi:hypothetical protein